MKKTNALAGHFNLKRLFAFTVPTIGTIVLCNTFEMVNGFFASNILGKEALAAINLVGPILLIYGSLGYMIGIGGGALLSVILGRGEKEKANSAFTTIFIFTILFGIILSVVAIFTLELILHALGTSGEVKNYALIYGEITSIFIAPNVIFICLSYLLITAGKPKLNLAITLISFLSNAIFSYLFTGPFGWGVAGVAFAFGFSFLIGILLQILYFAFNKTSNLKISKPSKDLRIIGKSLSNGIGEYIANITESLICTAYNFQLIHIYQTTDSVAAFGCMNYWLVLFCCILFGFVEGAEPLIAYNYGANNKTEIRSLFKRTLSVSIIYCVGVSIFMLFFARIFIVSMLGYDVELVDKTEPIFKIYFLCFLFLWGPIFGAALFTAFNNGKLAALISFVRSFVLELGLIFLLPALFGPNSIWFAVTIANLLASILVVILLLIYRKRYSYI